MGKDSSCHLPRIRVWEASSPRNHRVTLKHMHKRTNMHIQILVSPWSVTWRNRRHHHLLCPSRPLSLLSSQLHTYVCVFPRLRHDPQSRAHLSPCVAPQHLAQGDWSGMFAVRPMWAPEVQEVWGHRCGRYSPHLHKPPASSGRRGHSHTLTHTNMCRHPPTHTRSPVHLPSKGPCSFRVWN